MAEQENKLGTAPVGRLLTSLGHPPVSPPRWSTCCTTSLTGSISGIFRRLAPRLSLGVGVTFPIITIISAFSALVGMGGAPRASIRMGQKDNKGAEKILGNCLALSIVLSVLLIIIFEIFGQPLLWLFGASENTISYGWEYMSIYVLGTFFVTVTMGPEQLHIRPGLCQDQYAHGYHRRRDQYHTRSYIYVWL